MGAHTLLIIYAAHLKAAAGEWSAYRASSAGGQWNVILHEVAADDNPAAQRRDIRAFIREHAGAAQLAVLLLGDAPHTDSSGDPGIATWRFPQPDPVLQSRDPDKEPDYATDHPYQLLDDKDDVPDIALGRVPAQTLEDARGLLEKIKRYEAPPSATASPPSAPSSTTTTAPSASSSRHAPPSAPTAS